MKLKQKIQQWVRRILGIDDVLNKVLEEVRERIGERTTINADIGYRSKSTVIIIGEYKNRDYVNCFQIAPNDMEYFVDMMHDRERRAKVGRFDEMYGGDFKAILKRRL